MGLFINDEKHPEVYKNEEELIAQNQNIFRRDEIAEMLKAQQQASHSLQIAIQELEKAYTKQARAQMRRLTNVRNHIEELYDGQMKQRENDGLTSKSIEAFHEKTASLAEKVEQQMTLQKEIAEKSLKQEAFQDEVLQRLENQEALTEKILRKIDHFRSILYERTNFISERIGKGYDATSLYIAKLIKNHQTEDEKNKKYEQKSKS